MTSAPAEIDVQRMSDSMQVNPWSVDFTSDFEVCPNPTGVEAV
jgi:hypothetical protein